MAEKSATDRYVSARQDLDAVRESLDRTADLLDRVSRALRQRPITLPVEGIGKWEQIRTQPGVLARKEWSDFDRLKSLIESVQESERKEEQTWQQVPRSVQPLFKRS